MDEFWVFGYGSLMWNPGFAFAERVIGTAHGYHRALCVRSWVHRGTEQRPGLVLGLDRGGACRGVAFRIEPDRVAEVVGYLRERELVTHVYVERMIAVRLADGRRISAHTYAIDRGHRQYAGKMDPAEAARIVRGAVGKSGRNEDYLMATLRHMREIGIRDDWMEEVGRLVG